MKSSGAVLAAVVGVAVLSWPLAAQEADGIDRVAWSETDEDGGCDKAFSARGMGKCGPDDLPRVDEMDAAAEAAEEFEGEFVEIAELSPTGDAVTAGDDEVEPVEDAEADPEPVEVADEADTLCECPGVVVRVVSGDGPPAAVDPADLEPFDALGPEVFEAHPM